MNKCYDSTVGIKNNQKLTFIFCKEARNSKNDSTVVDTLWRISVSGSLHQNILAMK